MVTSHHEASHRIFQDRPELLAARAPGTADRASVSYYSELLEIGLGETPAREIWRNLMNVGTFFPGRGTLIEETYLKGKAEDRAEIVLRILEQRGIPTPAETRQRIGECTDLDVLGHWVDRALVVSEATELFDGES